MALPLGTFCREQSSDAAVGNRQVIELDAFSTLGHLEPEDDQCERRPQRGNCMLPAEFEMSINQLRLERPELFEQQQGEEGSGATASTSPGSPSALVEIQSQSDDKSDALGLQSIMVEL
eukprot:TRINITY_DN7211_c0_g1_i1.p1 TRINITY_DN7211_c0_g1~~TRINITY_DN7211_c0_g1_i1.p1  ORF type:complete len:119 (+),score=32.76 TRINITY_DN7211_c0_g1_i1:123-479(+)